MVNHNKSVILDNNQLHRKDVQDVQDAKVKLAPIFTTTSMFVGWSMSARLAPIKFTTTSMFVGPCLLVDDYDQNHVPKEVIDY